ncbi:MAG: hypothetical protein ACR2J5_06600 [Geodermatophilaceae bacterium]
MSPARVVGRGDGDRRTVDAAVPDVPPWEAPTVLTQWSGKGRFLALSGRTGDLRPARERKLS